MEMENFDKSTVVLCGVSALVIICSRMWFKSPKIASDNSLFQSKHFSDQRILLQLCDGQYQTKLSAHKWPELERMSPCFWTLAESILTGKSVEEALAEQSELLCPKVRVLLESRIDVLLQAMRVIAESYLARELSQNPSGTRKKEDWTVVPQVVLNGTKGKKFRPVEFIARGSAGAVYTAVRVEEEKNRIAEVVTSLDDACIGSQSPTVTKFKSAVSKQLQRQLALKRIEPTQKSSAENEYRVAAQLAENDTDSHCIAYLDRAEESEDELWLLLRRINPSPYGIDLTEYIGSQIFEKGTAEYQSKAQEIVLKLLNGVSYISNCGVSMRDVKPDNVLVEHKIGLDDSESFLPRWSDFGLSIHLGGNLDGAGIRHPKELDSDTQMQESLIGFWYDTQKLVPKPKWKGRRPPEQCFQNPQKVHLSSYDVYMVAIIIVSMALGIDVPHIDRKHIRISFEEKLGIRLPDDYLDTLELGQFMNANRDAVLPTFLHSFGKSFGEALFGETLMMLAMDPRERPLPNECVTRLLQAR